MSSLFNDALILASASPRRKELLRYAGLKFKTIPAGVDEDYRQGESPRQHVKRLSLTKAMAVARQYPRAWVLGADTIVVIDQEILGKPAHKIQAEKMLRKLSGREHQVLTGFTVAQSASEIVRTKVVRSWVRFKDITPEEMAWYVHSDEPYDKAGGYAAQGKGAYFIRSIRGSFTNVIGLPLCETLDVFKNLGLIHFR
jgi:septum formation protein